MAKSKLRQVGTTITNKPIMGGLFELADTFGFPLGCSLDECKKRGWAASIPDYVQSALTVGWPMSRILSKVKEALSYVGEPGTYPAMEKAILLLHPSIQLKGT